MILDKIKKLTAQIAGDSLRGLFGAAAEAKARTFTTPRVLELRAEAVGQVEQIRAELEDARAREERALKSYARDLADQGRSINQFAFDPAKTSVAQLEVCKRWISALKDELGLRDRDGAEVALANIIAGLNDRVRMLGQVLKDRYRQQGEPAEVLELRARLTEARRAEWPLRRAQKEAHEMNNGAGGFFEAEALAANAALAAAEAATAALRRELFARFALES
jgi:hypothetical protein